MLSTKINQELFYEPYHGHDVEDIIKIYYAAKSSKVDQIVWLAGDSTLDNKYWIKKDEQKPATHVYDKILDNPHMIQDVAYHVNTLLNKNQLCINTSIEATTLEQHITRSFEQDVFIKENVGVNDTLIVSCGGNDILFDPMSMMPHLLKYLVTGYIDFFHDIFHDKLKAFVKKLTKKTKPKKVIICILYYPNFQNPAGWASTLLSAFKMLGAENMVLKLIQTVYQECVSKIKITGLNLEYCPLYIALDGTNTNDYVSGVEPSVQGGKKIALLLNQFIDK